MLKEKIKQKQRKMNEDVCGTLRKTPLVYSRHAKNVESGKQRCFCKWNVQIDATVGPRDHFPNVIFSLPRVVWRMLNLVDPCVMILKESRVSLLRTTEMQTHFGVIQRPLSSILFFFLFHCRDRHYYWLQYRYYSCFLTLKFMALLWIFLLLLMLLLTRCI